LRRIPLSRRSHIIGFQPLPTGTVEHESALERDFVVLSSFLDPAALISSQPITIRYPVGAVTRRYTPDYLVAWSDGRREIVEVKYWSDLRANQAQLKERFAAVREWAQLRGGGFRVATEHDIRGCVLENARRLLPLRAAPLDPTLAQSVTAVVRERATASITGVIIAIPAERSCVVATIWGLLARGSLYVDCSQPITPSSLVRLP
jgi:TnsA endonuclease-like protein